tara:strand:+ start:2969 stop:3424 length:456 start_codon:yes stop_codon:yes gene_type:complete
MNRTTFFIASLFIANLALAVDVPPRCNGVEITYEGDEHAAGLSMSSSDYSFSVESDGEINYVSVTVPLKYNSLELKQINMIKLDSGSPVLSVGLSHHTEGTKAISKHALIWPSAFNSVRFNAFYADVVECQEGHSYYRGSQAYALEFRHNK